MIGISKLWCGAREASDELRYGREAASVRPVVVWNATRRCNLRCVQCYSSSTGEAAGGELTGEEAEALIDDLAAWGAPALLLSGGEPLLREDLTALIARATSRGLRTALSTNGTLLTERAAGELAEAGLAYAGVSLDGLRETNDRLRGEAGAFGRALAGMRNARRAGIKVGLRFTMTRRNAGQIGPVFDLVEREAIPRVCFYHLAFTGRGRAIAADALDAAEARAAVDLIIDRAAALNAGGRHVEVLTVDNHADGAYLVLRLEREDPERAEAALGLLRRQGGNGSGWRIGCVSWNGEVHPDPFWRSQVVGSVRRRPFSEIWADPQPASLLARLRDRRHLLPPRCRGCRWLDICNGNLRARAEAAAGDPWAEDPACYLTDEEIRPPEPLSAAPQDRRPQSVTVVADFTAAEPPGRLKAALRLLFWETTRRCNLACVHCRRLDAAADTAGELTTDEARSLLDSAAELGRPVIVFSGGEPLLRGDWEALAAHARSLSLPTALATNGTLIDAATAARIAAAGFRRVSVSLDGADAATHDAFRGVAGAFERAVRGTGALRRAGQAVQVNATVTAHNAHQLDALHALAVSLGAEALHVFLLVPVGCGAALAGTHQLSGERYEEVLNWVLDRQAAGGIELKATCAPHYYRLAAERGVAVGGRLGCLAGVSVAFVGHAGEVFPCGYLPVDCGNVRERPFAEIWRRSGVFAALRDPSRLKGRCGQCEYAYVCGGCRARAFAATGDYLAAEPACTYRPRAASPGAAVDTPGRR
jgi:radical SAM protein with 4Fe4S-binding SPASM domain